MLGVSHSHLLTLGWFSAGFAWAWLSLKFNSQQRMAFHVARINSAL
jgi:hypothetical protein